MANMMTLGGLTLGENSTGKNSLNVQEIERCTLYFIQVLVQLQIFLMHSFLSIILLAWPMMTLDRAIVAAILSTYMYTFTIHHSEAASCKLQVNEFHFILRILINIRTVLNLVLFFISGRFFANLEFRRLYFSIKKVNFNSYHT